MSLLVADVDPVRFSTHRIEARPMAIPIIPLADEVAYSVIEAVGARLTITENRLTVTQTSGHVLLDMAMSELRRIQFDIERTRPAALVIVPEHTRHEAQVLGIPPESYDEACRGLAYVGARIYGQGHPA